jgi:WD40 repeat protein
MIFIYDTNTFEVKSSLMVDAGTYGVRSVSFSPKGDMVAAGCWNGKIHFMDAAAGQIKSSVRGHSASVNCVDFSPDGLTIASGSGSGFENDNSVRVWDVKTGKQLWQLRAHKNPVSSVYFSPDGTKIASGSLDRTVLIWDAASGEQLCSLRGHRYAPSLSKEFFLSLG